MTLEFGQELAQEGDFQEDVAKEISVVKGGGFPWITIILPAARMRYSARFIMGIRRLCVRENWISMTCFFAAMNFCQEKRYPGGMAKQIPIHYGR